MSYSKIVMVEGRMFRYNYDSSVVEWIEKATDEMVEEDKGWAERWGKPLWNIGSDGYVVIDSIGLSRENWDKASVRKEYLLQWCYDLDEELFGLTAEFNMR